MAQEIESFGFTAEDIGVGLLESITLGLYREPGDVLREYISNEIDNEPAPTSVDIRIDRDTQSIVILGDGAGMNWDQFRNAVRVGISFKDPAVNIGFRGIGIWAGVAACGELTVATKSDGDDHEYELIVDCTKLRSFFSGPNRNKPLIEVLNACAGYRKRPSKRLHGTEVRMKGVFPSFQNLLDETEVRNYLTRDCPVAFEEGFHHSAIVEKYLKQKLPNYRRVRMTLNGTAVRGLHVPSDAREPIRGEVSVRIGSSPRRVTLGYYWLCHGKETARFKPGYDSGLRVRVKNFEVMQPGTLRSHIESTLKPGKKGNMHIFDYWVGEIHASHPELKPNAERRDLEPSLAGEQLIEYVAKDLFEDMMVPVSRALSESLRLGELADEALTISTTIKERDHPDVFAVRDEIDETDGNIEGLRSRLDDLKDKLRKLRKLEKSARMQGFGAMLKGIDVGIATKVERSTKRLKARRENLQRLFEKRKKAELGSAPSAETETGKGTKESKEGPAERPLQPTGGVGPAFDATPLLATIHREAARVATFQNDAAKLIEAFLIALVETGLCKSAKDLQAVTDALIRVSQRKR